LQDFHSSYYLPGPAGPIGLNHNELLHFYLEYADLTWSSWYRSFIKGWFADHIQLAVGLIATCQGLIAISMLLKGWLYKIGSVGAIIFLLSILPFGVGSGFPMHRYYGYCVIYFVEKDIMTN
jgi:hypothetical protein